MDRVHRVLLIDDHPLFRRGVRHLLGVEKDFEVVGEADSGEEGVALAVQLLPDLVLLDVQMQRMSGHATLRALREAGVAGRIVMLTVSESEEDLFPALRSGADGYLLKGTQPEDLVRKLREILAGHLVLTEGLTEHLARAMRRQDEPKPAGEPRFTPREREVLDLIAGGHNNKQIARNLNLSEGTVKVHVKHLLRKLGMRSRLEAALWAVSQTQK